MAEQADLFAPGVAEAPLLGLIGPSADPSAEIYDRLTVYGPSALDEEDTLVLLLSRCSVAGADLAGASAALMARFGGLGRIFGAPEPELAQVIGLPAARQLGLLHGLLLRVLEHPLHKREVLSSFSAVSIYLRAQMSGLPREVFRVLFLDKRNQLIADEQLGSGTIDHCPVYVREVIRRGLELNCAAMILSHNHPSCDPTPSAADIAMTKQIVAAGEVMKIAVHDHMIVAGDQVVSLRALGLM
jgi:DNA repair protein RadC